MRLREESKGDVTVRLEITPFLADSVKGLKLEDFYGRKYGVFVLRRGKVIYRRFYDEFDQADQDFIRQCNVRLGMDVPRRIIEFIRGKRHVRFR